MLLTGKLRIKGPPRLLLAFGWLFPKLTTGKEVGMTEPMILVTGASGKTGGAVVSQLRERGWPVRALVHRMDARAERLRAQGVEVVAADLFDPEQLLDAMRGTARAYYCPPWHPYMIQSAAAFAVAAQEAKLEAMVDLSQWLASPSHPSLATRQSWLVDRMFGALPGLAHTIVNPGFFADNYLRLIGFAAQLGMFPMPIGKSRNAAALERGYREPWRWRR